MRDISRKIIASLMLTMFAFSNTALTAGAMENAKPVLRDGGAEYSLRLKGDVNYIKNSKPISISLRDSDVKQVLRMFADKAGMNIIFHSSVSGNVTLDLVDVPLDKAFDMVMGITDMNYVVEDGTIIVAKSGTQDFNMAKQSMTLIPVKYVNASALADFLNKNIFKMHKPGISSSEIVTTNPATNELIVFGTSNDVAIAKKIVAQFDKKPTTTTVKVNHTTPEEMANMICKMLLPVTSGKTTGGAAGIMTGAASSSPSSSGSSSRSSSSSSSSSGSSGGSSLTLNSGKVACTIDGKSSGGGITSLGLQNLSVAYYPQLGTISILGGSENQIEMIKDFIVATDKKQPQAYLEVSIIELSEDASRELENTWNISSGAFKATFASGDTNFESVGKWNSNFDITYAIRYLVQNGKARVVVNPRIIITNGVESKIEVTEDYVESVDVQASTSTGGTVITRDYNVSDDKGVTINIVPFISPDGYVTLKLTPEYSTQIGTVEGTEVINDKPVTYLAATLLSHRNLDLQNVRIKDGETLVLAGMIQENETKRINKIPVLGDIPVLGTVFRSTITKKTKSEMMILITPKIITDNEDAVGVSETL